MNRREFISYGIGGAAAALASCTAKGAAGDEIKNVRAESPERQAAKMRALESAQELGPTITDVEVRRTRNIKGNTAAFYIDDVIFVFRELARNRPKSCWSHPLFSAFKEAHEEYWFKDYFAYQPDSREKLLTAVKMVHDAGYTYAFIEDKIDW